MIASGKSSVVKVLSIEEAALVKKASRNKLSCEILTPNDSRDPSYTKFTKPYYVICRERYTHACKEVNRQFPLEQRYLRGIQDKALGQVRLKRIFDYSVFNIPYKKHITKLTTKEATRLGKIMMD